MLNNNLSKRYTWKLYTGQAEEKGHLLRWMRSLSMWNNLNLNVPIETKYSKI
ncbi:MAG: hypothetical protein NZ529_00105 [Cytophagaceae bacterium]|nr:hypothetical protein [Cytophagaceae bacterium]MDW8455168.1 hypothetical protein [Cytophagaceae bacterium]